MADFINVDNMDWNAFIHSNQGNNLDKILGMIYGHALGDAVGLITEFKFKCDSPTVDFPYTSSIRNFPINDWTDDTDHLILLMQSLTENRFVFSSCDFATKLKRWISTGFEELGDTRGLGLGGTINMVVNEDDFLTDPAKAAHRIWYNSGKKLAPNGSLMRTSIIGCIPDITRVSKLAADISAVTHTDPRCISSCVLQSLLINNIIYQPANIMNGSILDIDKLLMVNVKKALRYIRNEPQITFSEMRHQPTPALYRDNRFATHEEEFSYWIRLAYTDSITSLKLDEQAKIGYVFKCLSCSIYALQVIKIAIKNNMLPSFEKFIIRVVRECGDADINAAVAGAIMGAYLGYSRLPKKWIEALPNSNWLNIQIMNFIKQSNITYNHSRLSTGTITT